MKKSEIKLILREHKKESMECLYPEKDYTWGTTKKNLSKTVKLLNKILKPIPKSAWPDEEYDEVNTIKDGNWQLRLMFTDGKRSADLSYAKDDHTAWVIEGKNGKFINFDIGGS